MTQEDDQEHRDTRSTRTHQGTVLCQVVSGSTSAKLEEEVKLQPRKIRFKNLIYLGLFTAWYSGVVLFIMYRLRSDDLDRLEAEAYDRIKISNQSGKNLPNQKYKLDD